MAILNFPNDPKIGETYDENGVRYTWEGVQWTAKDAGDYVEKSGDNMSGDLTLGVDNIVLDATDGNITAEGAITAVGDIQSTSQNGGQLAGFRNMLINGDFRVWQRGTSFTITPIGGDTATYMADRWASLDGGTHQQTDAAPAGFDYALTTDSLLGLRQNIELGRLGNNSQFAVGTTWTVSVWATGDLPNYTRTAPLFRGSPGSRPSGGATTTIATIADWVSTGETSSGFTRYSSKVNITGSVASTDTCVELYVEIPANTSCTGIQVEPGPVATPFEHRPIGTELALCQRYYVTETSASIALTRPALTGSGADVAFGTIFFPTEMRAVPTITYTVSSGTVGSPTRTPKLFKGRSTGLGSDTTSNITSYIADAEL